MSAKSQTTNQDAQDVTQVQVCPASPISTCSLIQDASSVSGASSYEKIDHCKKMESNKESLGDSDSRQLPMVELDERGRRVESRGECCHLLDQLDKQIESSLLYQRRERLKPKDFRSEVRAPMDVEQFVHQAELILDMREVSVEDIVEKMVALVSLIDFKYLPLPLPLQLPLLLPLSLCSGRAAVELISRKQHWSGQANVMEEASKQQRTLTHKLLHHPLI